MFNQKGLWWVGGGVMTRCAECVWAVCCSNVPTAGCMNTTWLCVWCVEGKIVRLCVTL